MDKATLGDRMKAYERHETDRRFMDFAPIVARMDGRGFSKWTKGLPRPYDLPLSEVMISVARQLVENTGARIGYTQSDEITLVFLIDDIRQSMMFDGKVQKLCSVLASMTTAIFITESLAKQGSEIARRAMQAPHFDARIFQLPTRTEAANAVLWREQDAARNSISTAAQAFYSQRELHGKNSAQLLEMILATGQDFNTHPAFFRRGTFLQARTSEKPFPPQVIKFLPEGADTTILRRSVEIIDMPAFSRVTNREAVIFDGADPVAD